MKKFASVLFLLGFAFGIETFAQTVGLYFPLQNIKSPCWYDIEYSKMEKNYYIAYISSPITREYCDYAGEMLNGYKVTPLDDGNVIIKRYDENGDLDSSRQYKLEKASLSIKPLSPLNFRWTLRFWNMSSRDVENCLKVGSKSGDSVFHFVDQTPVLADTYNRLADNIRNKCDNFAPIGMKCSQIGEWYLAEPVSSSECKIHYAFRFTHK